MKATTFFKILNRKIQKYDKMASNLFEKPQKIVLIWIEEDNDTDILKTDFSNE